MNKRKLIKKLAGGSFGNVSFADAKSLAESFGFRLARTSGSHHIFVNPEIPQPLNLQEAGGEAKPYQLRQLISLIEKYNLKMEGDEQ